jgi:hypothetical protein
MTSTGRVNQQRVWSLVKQTTSLIYVRGGFYVQKVDTTETAAMRFGKNLARNRIHSDINQGFPYRYHHVGRGAFGSVFGSTTSPKPKFPKSSRSMSWLNKRHGFSSTGLRTIEYSKGLLVHPALQIPLRQEPAFAIVVSIRLEAAEILHHECLAVSCKPKRREMNVSCVPPSLEEGRMAYLHGRGERSHVGED